MNPLLGRWISADPLAVHAPGSADLNVYAYVSGAVLKNIDPLGLKEKAPEGADPGVNADGSEGGGTGGGSDADPDPEAAADNSSNCGDSCGGASSSAVEAGRDVGSGHSGAPSEGKVEQGVGGGSSKPGLVVVGGFAAILCPACALLSLGVAATFDLTADTPAQQGTAEYASREKSGDVAGAFAPAAAGGPLRGASGGLGAAKGGRALSEAAKEGLKKELDDIGKEIVKQLDGAPSVEPKTVTEMGQELAGEIGRNRVSARTGSQQIDIDLAGKPHFEKSTGELIPTPHVRESSINVGPNGRTNLSDKVVREATKQDIRSARKIVERE